MTEFYDTHAHLDYPDFERDFSDVLARAAAAGISRMITIGTTLESSCRAIALAEKYPNIFAVVGWHPSYVMEAPEDLRPALREMAKHPKVVALGETGLDYHRLPSKNEKISGESEERSNQDEEYKQRQSNLFRQHLEVAAETGLNCVIHQRDSLEDTLRDLHPYASKVRGVFHCFSESSAVMKRIIEMGSLVSFTGIATFKNGQNVRDTLKETPLDKFMLETDCPYLAPLPYRGKRCEPAYVKEISDIVAQVKGFSKEELSAATCKTAREFFHRLR